MADRGPEFRELVGDDLTPEERARLERVHELLVAAGPPPELPPALAEPPGETQVAPLIQLPRRRAGAMLALAAAIALIAFVGGFVAGKQGAGGKPAVLHSLTMHGTAVAQNASAKIDLEEVDSSGNWPLRVVIHGLPRLSKGSYYEMFLTKNGKPWAACGIFTVAGDSSTIHLTMPPTIKGYDGWIVTRESPTRPRQVVLTT
jgi:Anti-sigma-K factor rskA